MNWKVPVTGLIVVIFVDDIITRGMPWDTEQFFNILNDTYALRSWGILTPDSPLVHLGFTITEEFIDGKLFRYLDQQGDVERFVKDSGLEFTGMKSSPMPDRNHILRDETLLTEGDAKWFKTMVGQLGWFAISLRWDIAHGPCGV